MQDLLKSFLSSCFPDRCDSIIGGKYMIKHIMFEEICFPSLRDLQDNYLSALEWWEGSFYYCIMTPMADLPLFPLFIFLSHLYSQTAAKMSRRRVTLWRHTCNSTSRADYIYMRVCAILLCDQHRWVISPGSIEIYIQRSPVSTSPALQICHDRSDREPLSHPAPTQESAKLRGAFVNLAACARQKQNLSQQECHDDKW